MFSLQFVACQLKAIGAVSWSWLAVICPAMLAVAMMAVVCMALIMFALLEVVKSCIKKINRLRSRCV